MKRLRIMSIVLSFIIAFTAMPIVAAAQEAAASVVFEASKPDKDGCFTLTMSVYNAKFNTFQFVLRYDPSTVVPVDSNGIITSEFFDFTSKEDDIGWLSSVGTSINLEKGLIDFTGYVTPGESVVSDGLKAVTGYANIGKSGIKIYSFNFKKTGSADIRLEIASSNDSETYSKFLPEGGTLLDAGEKIPLTVFFNIPVSVGKSHTVSPYRPKNEDVKTKEERIKNTIALQIGNNGAAVYGASLRIDTDNYAVTPYLDDNDRTMVPIRFVAERLGADVGWEQSTQQITITLGDKVIVMFVGSVNYTVNGNASVMDTEPVIIDGWDRTIVPVRFVAEALGMAVSWDSEKMLVLITPINDPWQAGREVEQEAADSILILISEYIRSFI